MCILVQDLGLLQWQLGSGGMGTACMAGLSDTWGLGVGGIQGDVRGDRGLLALLLVQAEINV